MNKGGRNGIGEKAVDTSHPHFIIMQEKIAAQVAEQSPEQRAKDQILGLRFRMMTYLDQLEPKVIIPTGAFIKELVEIINIKHKHFAEYIGYEAPNLSAIYRGRRKISIDLALKLENIFKIPAILWLNIQNKNDMLEARSVNQDNYRKFSLEGLLQAN